MRGSKRRLLLGRSAAFTPGIAREDQSGWRCGEDHALLACHKSRPTAADRNGRKVRIPAHAQSQGQARLHPILVVHVRIDLPALDVGQFAGSLLEAAHVTQQPVGKSIAGIAAAEADDGVSRVVGCVFDRPLVLQVDAHRQSVPVNGLDQRVGDSLRAADLVRGLSPAAVGAAEIRAFHIADRLDDADVARPAHRLAVLVQHRRAVVRALLRPQNRGRIDRTWCSPSRCAAGFR